MSEIETGTVVGVEVCPCDVKQNTNINANNEWSPYNYNRIVENCKEIKETLLITIKPDTENIFPFAERISNLGITSSWFCAIDCLAVGLYEPAVLFASISVECVLNHDIRLEKLRQTEPNNWINLNWRNLKCAHDNGLPTNLLLNEDKTFRKGVNIEFIKRRNKVAHGDIEGYISIYPPNIKRLASNDIGEISPDDFGHTRPSKQQVLDQIEKAKRFILEWAKQKPKVRLH